MQTRIQRKRTKGYRLPPNAKSVTRPHKWGNPLKWEKGGIYIHAGHRRKVTDPWVWLCGGSVELMLKIFKGILNEGDWSELLISQYYQIVNDNEDDLRHWIDRFAALDKTELTGKDLACFCPIDKPCHADVLLEWANEK